MKLERTVVKMVFMVIQCYVEKRKLFYVIGYIVAVIPLSV